ncbi:MAG: ATP-binding protein [Nitrospirae bacterium]|nr:ATP-binding protein [Nitrospirota bacterium]
MKEHQQNIVNSLAFRIIMPVIMIILLTGIGLYIFVLRSVSGFADRQIKKAFSEKASDINRICDENLNEILKKGLANDEKAVGIKKGFTIGVIEDYMHHNNLMGVIKEKNKNFLSACCLPPAFISALKKNTNLNEVTALDLSGKKYYIYSARFEPWDWHILLVRDAAEYSTLIRRVRFAYGITGATLFMAALMLIHYLNSAIQQPIKEIIAPLKKGEKPAYTGEIGEFEFISENIRLMMESLEEKTRWINHIHHIAVTRRGEEFFDEIAITIGKIFNLNSRIARVNPDSETATVFALYFNGELQKNITISLKDTLCEGVRTKKQMIVIEKDAYKKFPLSDGLTRTTKADSYIGFPVFDRKGEVIGIVNAFGEHREFTESDINLLQTIGQMVAVEFEILERETEKEKLIEQIIQEQKLESIGILANGIAHNFNNILVGVLGYASLIRIRLEEARGESQPALDEIIRYIDVIETSAQKASNLVRELGNLSKGRPFEERADSPVNIDRVMDELQKLLVSTFPKNIEIISDLPDDLPRIKGDMSQLEQAILNVCLNSKDAMPGGGTLIIKTRTSIIAEKDSRHPYLLPGRYVKITVADTGVGIDEENLSRIFEPFFTTKPADKATGLGLSIAYAIIKAHNGHILAESTPGAGSTFTIHLPAGPL